MIYYIENITYFYFKKTIIVCYNCLFLHSKTARVHNYSRFGRTKQCEKIYFKFD